MKATVLGRWRMVHAWSSLCSTLFLLLLCITGLPLIFHDDLETLSEPVEAHVAAPAGTPRKSLDDLSFRARAIYPGLVVLSVGFPEPGEVSFSLAPSWEAVATDRKSRRSIVFDAYSGDELKRFDPSRPKPKGSVDTVLDVMGRLHIDLYAGMPGQLFLGFMGLLFVVAIVSGVVLYGPFTRKLAFGEVRLERSRRTRWLDLHNLLGIVTLAWALIVGATGVVNQLARPMTLLWQTTDLAEVIAPWKDETSPAEHELASVDRAVQATGKALPDMEILSVIYPGGPTGNTHHFVLFTRGKNHFNKQLLSPVLVDARTGAVTAIVEMPWYLNVLELSRPLHFGDYGGLPMKVLWALLDIVTIIVLVSGLYLWLARRRVTQRPETGALSVVEPAK